ncbi:MAG: ROK family protein, partial [Thermoleophilia bacterium]|nr:ROK family protein [Thermoleophilia bacterium]
MYIGIDIGGTKIAAVLAGDDLTVVQEARLATPATQEELLQTLAATI